MSATPLTLTALVVKATNLPNVEKIGKSDPYCTIECQGVTKKTPKIDNELNPRWDCKLEFPLKAPLTAADKVKAIVYDHEKVGSPRLLGTAEVSATQFITKKKFDVELHLLDSNGKPNGGSLSLRLEYSGAEKQQKGEAQEQAKQAASQQSQPDAAPGGEMADAMDGNDGNYGDSGDMDGEIDGATRNIDTSGWSAPKRNVPRSSKPQDWQIRIKVIEARRLVGANISPVCQVACHKEMRRTRIKKSTNSPFWDQMFTFNFHASAVELCDQLVVFSLYNSRKLRQDALLCSFKCEIGLIHDATNRTLMNRWVLMADPDDLSAGPKGYLKISMCMLGPGDDAPTFKTTDGDEEDIESNILRPSGMQLRAASYQVRIYRCEDLPRMDPDMIPGIIKKVIRKDEKDMTDPFVSVSFAGKKVVTKTKYETYNPLFNEELKIYFQFPSMCERLRLQVVDWDRLGENDYIGASLINISEISAKGIETDDGEGNPADGFLPTLGPAYLTLYGSPREFCAINDFEHLNQAKGEGAAYRGRVLVELKAVLEEKMDMNSAVEISRDDVLRIEKFQRKRKFLLCAAFMSAGLISRSDDLVEFEVSIGNYGNMNDESAAFNASTTIPICALSDGNFYYYIPWTRTGNKPCCMIESNWEDTVYRLEALNVLLRIIDNLSSNLARINLAIKSKLPMQKTAQLINSCIDQLVWDCKLSLPEINPPQVYATELDRNLKALREAELKRVAQSAQALTEVREEESPEVILENTVQQLEGHLATLKSLAVEPQNSIPDVIVWMVIDGDKRVAYARIPANEVLYSPVAERCGRRCGKVTTVYLKKMIRKNEKATLGRRIPAQLRVKFWFGHHSVRNSWQEVHPAATVNTFAELYEYESLSIGKVLDIGKSRWSDAKGKLELNKDNFRLPPGWKFEGDWFLDPDVGLPDEVDTGHTHYVQDIYENEYRMPATEWRKPNNDYTDTDGNKVDKNMECPTGWRWQEEWAIDFNRPCDEEGWEYSIDGSKDSFISVAKAYHLCRRRRLTRARVRTALAETGHRPSVTVQIPSDGWEYGTVTGKFHSVKKAPDTQRRRRLHRRVVPVAAAESSEKQTDKAQLTPLRSYIAYREPLRYQLRAYIYQARDLRAGDDGGTSDPYAHVSFVHASQTTEMFKKTVCPKWDQTLIFNNVVIHSDPIELVESMPDVVVEIFDHDVMGEHDFLGRAICKPILRIRPSQRDPPALLEWWPVMRGGVHTGELLASFELFLLNEKEQLPPLPPQKHRNYVVPEGIRPAMQLTRIEILCWGVRNLDTYQFTDVDSPFVEFEIDGAKRVSSVIKKTKKNPNFSSPTMCLDVRLPVEQLYMPPMNVVVRDQREFGRKPIVGLAVIKHLEEMRHKQFSQLDIASPDPIGALLLKLVGNIEGNDSIVEAAPTIEATAADTRLPEPKESKAKEVGLITTEEAIDWWAKLYASLGEVNKCRAFLDGGYENDVITIYNNELEKCESHEDFADFCHSVNLYRGKSLDEDADSVGELKMALYTCRLEEDPSVPAPDLYFQSVPSNEPVECLVRLYVLRAFDLQPSDSNGLADPYVEVKLGKKEVSSRDAYVANTLNPVFGKIFELKCTLPLEKDLLIRVKDYDLVGSDDLIGETKVDLENRLMTKFRASCGLPRNYYVSGPFQWRDNQTPKAILESFCLRHHLPKPLYLGSEENSRLRIGSRVFRLREFEKKPPSPDSNQGPADERLALHVLNKLPLVKEHIETRPLYSSGQVGIEQGKLQMWLDIFPYSLGPPGPPCNITPRNTKKFELRVIIWNTYDVKLDEANVFGEMMSDIYVKGWLSGLENDRQETDVHYRSLNGEGNFNWRFIFQFDYMIAEQMIRVEKKEHFWSLDKTVDYQRPLLHIQVWDNDIFNPDDFLGTLELDLTRLIKPAKSSEKCDLSLIPDANSNAVSQTKAAEILNLFECRRQRGVWPCYSDENGLRELTGKVEMEVELLTAEESELRKAGRARDDPNENPHLDPPNRPETSFFWLTSPWKSFKHIFWKRFKWYIIGGICILLLAVFLVLFFYAIPSATITRLIGP